MRTLSRTHPAVCFLYMIAVIALTAVAGNPVVVLESLTGGVLLAALSGINGGSVAWIAAVAALANFLFVHNGETVLFFVGNTAFTLEALAYGGLLGMVLAAVCLWGTSAVKFVSSDKYIWLFGRAIPSAGLVLSCAVRFMPMFIRRTKEFIAVQTSSDPSGGTISGYLRAFSASVGYSAEQAMDSALSMRARGYGTARRTSYSLYRFTKGTAAALAVVALLAGMSAWLMIAGTGGFYFYPALSELRFRTAETALYCGFGALCLLPSAVILREKIRYKRSNNDPDKDTRP